MYDGRVHFSTNNSSPCAHFCNNDRGKVLSAECAAFYGDLSGDPYVTRTCPAGFQILFARLDDMLERRSGICVHLGCAPAEAKAALSPAVWSRCSPRDKKRLRNRLAHISKWEHSDATNNVELETIVSHVRAEVESRITQAEGASIESVLSSKDNVTFVNSFAHEVLTPLQQIRSSLERAGLELFRRPDSTAGIAEIIQTSLLGLERVRVAVEGMRLLFNLDPSIEENRLRTIDARPIIEAWVEIHRREIEAKNIKVIYKNAPAQARWPIRAVPEYFEVLVRNLVSNAVKYSYDTSNYEDLEPGKILFGYSPNTGVFRVTSYGVPIRKDEIDSGTLFELTHRGSQSGDRGRQGRGVGLFVVKKVCDLHGWKIEVSSDPINPTRPASLHCAKTEFSITLGPATERYIRRWRRR